MLLVQRDWDEKNIRRLEATLVKHQDSLFKGFEWEYWNRKLRLGFKILNYHRGDVKSVTFSPDGKLIVSACGHEIKL